MAVDLRGNSLADLMSAWGYNLVQVFGDFGGVCAPFTCLGIDGIGKSTVDYIWTSQNVVCPAGASAHTLHWADRPRPSCHAALTVDLTLPPRATATSS